jgi:hypothetical protein
MPIHVIPHALDTVPSEMLWHALAARYHAAIFAGVRDADGDGTLETVETAALGEVDEARRLVGPLAAYIELSEQAMDDDDAPAGWPCHDADAGGWTC